MKRSLVLVLAALPAVLFAQHAHHAVQADAGGIVMNANADRPPRGCDSIAGDIEFTVHAGRDYAAEQPGMIFGMSERELHVPPCSRVTVHFVNEDAVRHQWMVHGLPRYLYPGGMFHLEAMGGSRVTGTFIVPAEDRSYLVHCDMAQHMEKGMRAQLVVGRGSGDLWAVPGVSDAYRRSPYLPRGTAAWLALAVLASAALTAGVLRVRARR